MLNEGAGIAHDIVVEAKRIEREKNGKALTDDEARTIKAADFLRQIAPYMFTPKAD